MTIITRLTTQHFSYYVAIADQIYSLVFSSPSSPLLPLPLLPLLPYSSPFPPPPLFFSLSPPPHFSLSPLPPPPLVSSSSINRGEIGSGTVVTYNDRQEILCQECTDIALNEPNDEGVLQQRTSVGNSRSMDREVGKRRGRQWEGREDEAVDISISLSRILLLQLWKFRLGGWHNHFIDVDSSCSDRCGP